MEIINKVRNTIRQYEMLEKGDRVLVCLSGGPDSVFLLKALLHLKDEFKISLFIANLDHGLRGKASERDSSFVKALAGKWKIKLFFKKLNFKKDKKLSIEETARKKRYNFFDRLAEMHHFDKIATAHTKDDLAETILMRIIKGTSLKGIVGIPPKRLSEHSEYIRPLVEIEKKDIIAFLKKNHINFKVDRTNLDNKFFRNMVRNRIIPYLSRYNPQVKNALVNLSESLREDKDFIENHKNKINDIIRNNGSSCVLYIKDIVVHPKAIQREIARDALIMVGSDIKRLNFHHWKEIYALIRLRPSGKSLDLPGKVRLTKVGNKLFFKKKT